MPTLKEIKGRIGSVQNTLKITSAMKLVSSAKLRKAQTAIENMRPYQEQLQRILGATLSAAGGFDGLEREKATGPVLVVAVASNTSLCGGFNANAVAKVRELLKEYPDAQVVSVGRKMADAMKKAGRPSPSEFAGVTDLNALSAAPAFSPAAALVSSLMEACESGRIGKVFLVYNHYVSASRQEPVAEQLLPASAVIQAASAPASGIEAILEPSAAEILESLVPKTLKLKLFTALLDSAAAEHAARTVAMQTATDNGEELLEELTLQYNKGRQQKITSEILDLAGGQNP